MGGPGMMEQRSDVSGLLHAIILSGELQTLDSFLLSHSSWVRTTLRQSAGLSVVFTVHVY